MSSSSFFLEENCPCQLKVCQQINRPIITKQALSILTKQGRGAELYFVSTLSFSFQKQYTDPACGCTLGVNQIVANVYSHKPKWTHPCQCNGLNNQFPSDWIKDQDNHLKEPLQRLAKNKKWNLHILCCSLMLNYFKLLFPHINNLANYK